MIPVMVVPINMNSWTKMNSLSNQNLSGWQMKLDGWIRSGGMNDKEMY